MSTSFGQAASGIPNAQQRTHGATGTILGLAADASHTRVCLLEPVNQRYRLLSWREAPRVAAQPLYAQLAELSSQLGDSMGRTLWDSTTGGPFLRSKDPVGRPPLEHVVAAASVRPWLRIWLAGLSRAGSLSAAQQLLDRGPFHLVGQTVLEADANVSEIGFALADVSADVLLICGGYEADHPPIQAALLRLAELFINAINRLAPTQHPLVLFAGNRQAAASVEQIFRTRIPTVRFQSAPNVLPRPGRIHYANLFDLLEQEHLRLSRRITDYHKIASWLTGEATTVSAESAFVRFVRAWRMQNQLDDLHALSTNFERWMHVRVTAPPSSRRAAADPAEANAQVELVFATPGSRSAATEGWPTPQLVSGAWPETVWPRPQNGWWDRRGLLPPVATVGQISPEAMLQVVKMDLF